MASVNYDKEQNEYGLNREQIQKCQATFGAVINGYAYSVPSQLNQDKSQMFCRVNKNGTISTLQIYEDKAFGAGEWLNIDQKLGFGGKSIDKKYIQDKMDSYKTSAEKEFIVDSLQQKLIEDNYTADIRVAKYYHDMIQVARAQANKGAQATFSEESSER